jgi:hypothetical protein
VFVTFKCADIDQLSPRQRVKRKDIILNKIAVFLRDNGSEVAYIWSRESEPVTGAGEHLHVVLHVPPHLRSRFGQFVSGWYRQPGEVHMVSATYQTRWTRRGKRRRRSGTGWA